MPKTDPLPRLLAKIDRRGDDECWPWKGYINKKGYGMFSLNGKMTTAVRAVVLLIKGEHLTYDRWRRDRGPRGKGPVGARREVRHLCNKPICCNPAHVEYSNHSQNVLDSVSVGTYKGNQKLTPADYTAILASSDKGVALAKKFGITRWHVYKIRHGKFGAAYKA